MDNSDINELFQSNERVWNMNAVPKEKDIVITIIAKNISFSTPPYTD